MTINEDKAETETLTAVDEETSPEGMAEIKGVAPTEESADRSLTASKGEVKVKPRAMALRDMEGVPASEERTTGGGSNNELKDVMEEVTSFEEMATTYGMAGSETMCMQGIGTTDTNFEGDDAMNSSIPDSLSDSDIKELDSYVFGTTTLLTDLDSNSDNPPD